MTKTIFLVLPWTHRAITECINEKTFYEESISDFIDRLEKTYNIKISYYTDAVEFCSVLNNEEVDCFNNYVSCVTLVLPDESVCC